MPRKSRVKDNYGVYHIKQNGSGLVKLFDDDRDRESFLDILIKAGEKNNFRILAYCISEADEYHLILDANGCDISKVMKEINIRYSIFKDCQGCLFKDRFQSELLNSTVGSDAGDGQATWQAKGETSFSVCTEFLKKLDEMTVLDQATFESPPIQVRAVFQRGCQERINTLEEARAKLTEQAAKMGKDIQGILKDKPLRNDLIRRMKACSTLSMKQIGELFGGLSESSVSKLLNTTTAEADNLR